MYTKLTNIILNALKPQFALEESALTIERPKDRTLGHIALPLAFVLAKSARQNPKILAEQIAQILQNVAEFKAANALNGFVNITLKDAFLDALASEILKNGFCAPKAEKPQKILLEFVSANPTGPLHIGHARGAIYGDALARVGRFLGEQIFTEYYINDNGLQVANLANSALAYAANEFFGAPLEEEKITYKGEYVRDLARTIAETLGREILEPKAAQEPANFAKIAALATDLMMDEIRQNLAELDIKFDNFVSEKAMFARWDGILERLQSSGKTYYEGSTLFLKTTDFGDDKDRVITRDKVQESGAVAENEPTYLAGDIIYHDDKFARNFDRYINIWGADHHGYVARVRAALAILGRDQTRLEVLLSQMVGLLKNGEAYKMSKRAGNFILLKDVVADIGADALRFIFATKRPDTPLEFDVAALSVEDASNPVFYVNYANARIHTLLGKSALSVDEIKAANLGVDSKDGAGVLESGDGAGMIAGESGAAAGASGGKTAFGNVAGATESSLDTSLSNLLFSALCLPHVAYQAFRDREIQKIAEFLKNLAADFHAIYNAQKVLGESDEAQRLKVFLVVSAAITKGMELLGITAKTKM